MMTQHRVSIWIKSNCDSNSLDIKFTLWCTFFLILSKTLLQNVLFKKLKGREDFCTENPRILKTLLLTYTNIIPHIFMGYWISQAEELVQLYCTWGLFERKCRDCGSSRSNNGKFMLYQSLFFRLLKETYQETLFTSPCEWALFCSWQEEIVLLLRIGQKFSDKRVLHKKPQMWVVPGLLAMAAEYPGILTGWIFTST